MSRHTVALAWLFGALVGILVGNTIGYISALSLGPREYVERRSEVFD